MQYVLSKFKIRTGKVESTRKFLESLHAHHQSEMAIVLKEANMNIDCSFIDGEYLFIFKRLELLEHLKQKISSSNLKIYEEIRNWYNDSIESREDLFAVAAFDPS